jgi:neurotransmitter:Na+ symporter, NSS family
LIETREQWGSNLGFIFAAVGSAVGIGNIWRFPYIVGTNGGGAFLLCYVIVLFSFGLAFMVLELAIGRHYKTSVLSAFERINKRFKWIGLITIGTTFAILSYYLVILGWVLYYFLTWVTIGTAPPFDEYINSMYPVLSFFGILAINFAIIRLGVRKGIETLSKIGVLFIIAIMIPLTMLGLSLEGSEEGIAFYLTPDLGALAEPKTWSTAFGQAFFSLSVGMGVLLVYASYLRRDRSILTSSIIIVIADLAVAFIAGLMIFSIVFASELQPDQGTTLVFQVMPSIFSEIEYYGVILGGLFFCLLLIAGITSSISLFQVPVSAIEDTFNVSKSKATAIIAGLLSVSGLLPALSYSSLNLHIWDIAFFDLYDIVFGTYGIAISGAIFSVIATWFVDKRRLLEEVNMKSPFKVPVWVLTIVKFLMPTLIIATILSQILGF